MRLSGILFAVVGLELVISLLCIWFYPSVGDFMASNSMWNGMRDSSSEIGASDIDSLQDLPDLPQETALVLIPHIRPGDQELSRVSRFVNGGGTLLLMDDYGYGNDVLSYLDLPVRFSNKPLLDPLFCYKNQWLPLITDFSPEVTQSGVGVVMLNHATALTGVEASQVIAWSSGNSFLDDDGSETWTEDEPRGPLPIAASLPLGKGTITVVSDPSIMINSMVKRQDNYRFIRYLCSQDGKQLSILIDRSHLATAPLDVSKMRLISFREIMRSPYVLLGVLGLIFVAVSRYTLWKGKSIG